MINKPSLGKIQNDEFVIRYVFNKGEISKDEVRRKCFLKKKKIDNISVMRSKNCSEDCLIKLSEQARGNRTQTWRKTAAQLLKADIELIDQNLSVKNADQNNHRRHAIITTRQEQDQAWHLDMAEQLARASKVLIFSQET